MLTVNISEAQERLPELVQQAKEGQSFIIANDGRPLVKVLPYEETNESKRLGFMRGQCVVPDDVKAIGRAEITALFEGRDKADEVTA